jgi:hypothetical protein
MNSTPNGKATESDDVSIAPACEKQVHAYEQIAAADCQITRADPQRVTKYTSDPKVIETNDAWIARADERLAYAYEQLARDHDQLARVTEQLSRLEHDVGRNRSAVPGRLPFWPLPSRRSRPMVARPSRSLPDGRHSSFRRHRCRLTNRDLLRSRAPLPLSWPQRSQCPQHPRPKQHRKRWSRQLPRCLPSWRRGSRRWRAISQTWSARSSSSRRARNKWPATMQAPLSSSKRARSKRPATMRRPLSS